MNKMRCPFCKGILKYGGLEYYETLCEHVCDPNGDHGTYNRPIFICDCSISENCFWDPDGDFYTNELSKGHRLLIFHIKNKEAIGSMWENIRQSMHKDR